MNDNRGEFREKEEDLRLALTYLQQATQCLPEESEEIKEDLLWVEESLEQAIDACASHVEALECGGDELYTDSGQPGDFFA